MCCSISYLNVFKVLMSLFCLDVGHYMYIYSNINRHGKTARLISKTLPSTNQTCFSFWYYMYGYDVNTLKVLVNGSQDVTVWSRTGQSVNRWLQGQVTLSSEDAFQVLNQ